MLRAILKTTGEDILIYLNNQVQLKEWSNNDMLLCPGCGRPYEYCHGRIKQPYFRHKEKCECDIKYGEPETEEHLQGKRDLYEWVKTIDGTTNVVLEGYIKETQQKPDIMFNYNNKTIVIEYQCSPISTEYIERYELYQSIGIQDIWIMGINNFLGHNRYMNKHLKFYYNPFEKTVTINPFINAAIPISNFGISDNGFPYLLTVPQYLDTEDVLEYYKENIEYTSKYNIYQKRKYLNYPWQVNLRKKYNLNWYEIGCNKKEKDCFYIFLPITSEKLPNDPYCILGFTFNNGYINCYYRFAQCFDVKQGILAFGPECFYSNGNIFNEDKWKFSNKHKIKSKMIKNFPREIERYMDEMIQFNAKKLAIDWLIKEEVA